MNLTLRDATPADIPAIFDLLNREIAEGVNTFKLEPIDAAGQQQWWKTHEPDQYPVLVAEVDEGFAGWGCLSAWSATNGGYFLTAEVSLWLAPNFRGLGIGKALLAELIERAKVSGLRVLVSKIEAGNTVSLALHKRFHFSEVGVLHRVGHKFGQSLDVAIFELPLCD